MSMDWDSLLDQLKAAEPGWVTVAEACEAAGVSRSTLRGWYRTGEVPSRMVSGVHGPQRLVPLEVVIERAMQSARVRRQLDRARSMAQRVADLEARVAALERAVGR
jgi:transposase